MGYIVWALLGGWVASLLLGLLVARRVSRRLILAERRATKAERLAELGTFTSELAHEIKNPLSTVQLNLQLLKEDLDPHAPSYDRLVNRLQTVQRETARLNDILDDFRRYAGKIEVERQPVDLNDLLEELIDFFTPQSQLQRVQLRLNKADRAPVVQADPRLLKQAVLNLMINALQAMPHGGELILQLTFTPREAQIHVIDTGDGIDPKTQQRIFNAYYSTKKGGSGLGLAMTRRIIAEHGGHISLESEPQKGSDFILHLPLGSTPTTVALSGNGL